MTDALKTPVVRVPTNQGRAGCAAQPPALDTVNGLGIEQRTRWLDQMLEDPSQGNAAFVAAYAVSAALLRDGGAARTSLAALAAFTGRGENRGDPSTNIRDGLFSLEQGGHLHIERQRGRGLFHRYILLFKSRPKRNNPPLDPDPKISLERLPALLAAFREVVAAARAAGLPID